MTLSLVRPLTPREAFDGWAFSSMASVPIYVVLTPPGGPLGSIPLPLAGLPVEHRKALAKMRRGDRVPSLIVAGLLTLSPRWAAKPQLGPQR